MHKIKTNEKRKKNKKNVVAENEITFKKIVIIVGSILVIFALFYLLTFLILKNEKKKETDYSNATLYESSKNILMSDILRQSGEKYLVLAIMDDEAEMYDLYLNGKDNIYYINLDNALNKTVISDETIIDEDPRNIKISDTTLFVIENNEIVEYYVSYDDVIVYLRNM